MAIVAPVLVTATYAADLNVVVTVATDTTGWTMTAVLRAQEGGTALATKTTSSGITNSPGASSSTVTIAWSAANLTQAPGAYVWDLRRSDSGSTYQIVDPSGFLIEASGGAAYPRLTNLAEYLSYTRGSPSPSDADAAQLLLILADSEEFLQRLCNRRFNLATSMTFYLDGNGQRDLLIPRTPVQSVSSVKVDPTGYYGDGTNAFSSDALTVGTDYVLVKDDPDNAGHSKSGILRRIGAVWPYSLERGFDQLHVHRTKSPGSVKVIATCGYTTIPMPIKRAVWDLTTLSREASLRGRLMQSQAGEGYSRSFTGLEEEASRLNSVRAIVGSYRRIVI